MTDNSKTSDQDISLCHENVMNDPVKVSRIFNEYFLSAVSNIGNEEVIGNDEIIEDILSTYKGCEIIYYITYNVPHDGILKFSPTTVEKGNYLLNKTDPTKAYKV